MITAPIDLDYLYKTYSPMLWGMALEISTSKHAAEEIIVQTFLKTNNITGLMQPSQKSVCVTLIKLMTKTAKEVIEPEHFKNNIECPMFENAPITHKILFEQNGFENYCSENQTTRLEAAKKIRAELLLLR